MTRPFVLGIAGSGSHSGKTSLARTLVVHLTRSGTRVGGLKVATATPDHRCERTGAACTCLAFDGRARLLFEPEYLDHPGKDTQGLRSAGADPVAFLQTTRDVATAAVAAAIADERFAAVEVLVVEGAEVIRQHRAGYSLLVVRADGRPPKPGTERLARLVDRVILSTLPGVAADASLAERFGHLARHPPLPWTVGGTLPPDIRADLAHRPVAPPTH